MSSETDLGAKAAQDLLPAVADFASATGITAPIQELARFVADTIRYKRAPYTARLLREAAARIRESGLPPSAVEDRFLRAAVEDGSIEDDDDMRERWANLLANAGTQSAAQPKRAFTDMLRQIEPEEASLLDDLVSRREREKHEWSETGSGYWYAPTPYGVVESKGNRVGPAGLENLRRLGLVSIDGRPPKNWDHERSIGAQLQAYVDVTALGVALVHTCKPPKPARAASDAGKNPSAQQDNLTQDKTQRDTSRRDWNELTAEEKRAALREVEPGMPLGYFFDFGGAEPPDESDHPPGKSPPPENG